MKNFLKNLKINIFLQWLLLFVLLFILCLMSWQIVFSIESLKLSGDLSNYPRRVTAGAKIVPDQIRGWMTFRYISMATGVNADVLKQALGITDKKYPNITVNSYAKQSRQKPEPARLKVVETVTILLANTK